jgi:hypothetical protein
VCPSGGDRDQGGGGLARPVALLGAGHPRHAAGIVAQVADLERRQGGDEGRRRGEGTTHTFRHFFCSFTARQSVSPFKLMKLMGHDSLEIVLQYCHVSEDELFDAIAGVPFEAMLRSETNEAR